MTVLDAAELFRQLDAAGVEYVVIGGFAVIAHGVIRATKDVNVCPSPDRANLARLAGLLRRLNARQVGAEDFDARELPADPTHPDDLAQGGNFLVETDLGRLNIMQWVPGLDEDAYAQLDRSAPTGRAFGVEVRVASLDDLRLMKHAAGRPQDRRDLADLDAARGEGGASR